MHLYTIGHSIRSLEEMIELLHHYKISHLVDVRTIPKSRHVPWFNNTTFAKSLRTENIEYLHFPELGGLRHAQKNSINEGWRNSSFRGYADYMQTSAFLQGLEKLNQLIEATHGNIAIMCAEALPWRCHRSLIADAELIRDITVDHIMNKNTANPHQLTTFAHVDNTKKPIQIYYPLAK